MTLSRATNVAFFGGGRRSAHTTHPSASSFFRGEFSCATDSSRDGEFWIGNGLLFFVVLCTNKTHKKAQSAKKGPKKKTKKRTTTTGVGPRSECTHNNFIIMPRRTQKRHKVCFESGERTKKKKFVKKVENSTHTNFGRRTSLLLCFDVLDNAFPPLVDDDIFFN